MNLYRRCGKRMLDLAAAIPAVVILSPVLGVTAILVRVKLGSPVLFAQLRPGKGKRIFKMFKFRTMTNETDAGGNLLPDEKRLTDFGKFLRSTSLDELPELFNIIRGDMSLVGPRPQLVRDMVFMNEEQNRRHSIPQGLTGLAQVNGRNAITWEQKLAYDVRYLRNITFRKDMAILCRTLLQVFRRDGISTEGMETAEDFGDYLLRTDKVTAEEYIQRQREARLLLKRMEKAE